MKELVEEWRDVIGSSWPWKVSNYGRLALKGKIVDRKRRQISIRGKGSVSVGRLVLEAFVGPCPEGMECCHGDGDNTNNRLDNVRWDTHSNNMADARRHQSGGWFRDREGEDHPYAKLTEARILEAKQLRECGYTYVQLDKRYGVTTQAIWRALNGYSWACLTTR